MVQHRKAQTVNLKRTRSKEKDKSKENTHQSRYRHLYQIRRFNGDVISQVTDRNTTKKVLSPIAPSAACQICNLSSGVKFKPWSVHITSMEMGHEIIAKAVLSLLLISSGLLSITDQYSFEPPHDKPTKWPLCPAKTQFSLGIYPVRLESSLGSQGSSASSCGQRRLSLCWVHIPYC